MRKSEWANDPRWKAFEASFMKDGLPKIRQSDITMSLMTSDPEDFDAKQAIEIGAMLILDKPIILLVTPGTKLSTRLGRAADLIIYDWEPTPAGQTRLQQAIEQMLAEQERQDHAEQS